MYQKTTAPDWNLSPYSGLNRQDWIDISYFFLEGIFRHVKDIHDPIVPPRHEKKVSYPQPDGPRWRVAAERFEGLARSFLIGAPLLHNEPDAEVCGYRLRDYYKDQILLSVTPGTKNYLLRVEEIFPEALPGEKAFQHTCECASLVIGLSMCREVIWDTYTQEEKDKIADYLSNFGHSFTGHHNWRLFNMLILGFLDHEGYEVDRGMIRDHAQAIVSYYAGNGWYRDGHSFDYYCPWAFHVYGPLWNQWYGYEKEPYLAAKIEEYSNRLVTDFPAMFDRDAKVTMWGRSSIYRSAAAAPLAANFLLNHSKADPGLARRIASGSLLQFITKEECFYEGIPCLGFYGPFAPLLQSYSCAASPFWIANSFVCLALPEDHPFWTAKENNGLWEQESEIDDASMNNQSVQTRVWDGPGILADNHLATGITEFRTGKVLFAAGNNNLNGYSRLSFNSQFPWEAFDFGGREAMQYSLTYDKWGAGRSGELPGKPQIPNIILYGGVRDGVLYRKEYFDFSATFQDKASIDLADIPVKMGILRVDKSRIPDRPYRLTFGSYGLPLSFGGNERGGSTEGETIEKICPDTGAKAVILKGAAGQVAMVSYTGFEKMAVIERTGVNPVSEESRMIVLESRRERYYTYLPYVMITAVLTRKDGEEFTDEELFPVKAICFTDTEQCGGYGPVIIELKDGRRVAVDYEGIEGRLMI